ncbi:uncharacterized protein L969DRAFT_42565 [Mixia osmundae IAM 14324]|uniref:Ribosomal protein/NADH dehydrogenase domain-containing protein n=1 Tax=Mixia osmundae (strain CBS 9802 / IAM 14324 / JCM 22182 / KY 12970) TaxID=764103 RepID=G7E3V2_MIXOS|nr:uncharacterized protein L969DRAFT_42565 [Mixia osmundae IAM 14324]KEI41957.1 hypothetical protein L969DRAFT_42565 [Mixia osmundae IAM 14324]GAA97512.1 hypothetical protein E5Q_04190 [Mixia osmundae IAM 14324]
MASALRKALPAAVREIRILACQTSEQSAGARNFIQKAYLDVKKANPDLPIMFREAQGTPARAFVRLERGVERQVSLSGAADSAEVEKRIASILPS